MSVSLMVPVRLLLRQRLSPSASFLSVENVSSSIPLALAFLTALMLRAETERPGEEGREGARLGAWVLGTRTCCHLMCWCELGEGLRFRGMLISQALVTSVTAHWTTKCEHTI